MKSSCFSLMKKNTALLCSVVFATSLCLATEDATKLRVDITHPGTGEAAKDGQVVIAHYTGTLEDGTVFDSSRERDEPFAFTLGREQVIKGWDIAFAQLRVGDRATLTIAPELAYGDRDRDPIPPRSTLIFDVELLDLKDHALSDLLAQLIDEEGVDAAEERFTELREEEFEDYFVSESQLNMLGYQYLGKAQMNEALAVMEMNVALHPTSGNTHDSLAEIYYNLGRREDSLHEYRRSLDLDPSNTNAEKFIKELTEFE
jgi:tetratricopeptide (TPR) repeat protein